MRKNWKRIAALMLATVTAASLLAGCGKKGKDGSAGNTAAENLSETVFVPEYVDIDFKQSDNDYLDLYNAEIVGKTFYAVKTHNDENSSYGYYDQFSLETGELISEVPLGGDLNDQIDFDSIVPDKYKDKAEKNVGVNYARMLSNGKVAAVVNAAWYIDNEDPNAEWISGGVNYLALFGSDGSLEKFVPADISQFFPGDSVNVTRFIVDGNDNLAVMFTDWSGETSKSAVIVYDGELNQKNAAMLKATQVNGDFKTADGKEILFYYDADWTTHVSEFKMDTCDFGEEITGLPDYDINNIGLVENNKDKLVVNTYSKLMEYDFNKKETTEIANWMDMDIKDGNVSQVYQDADGAYYALISDYETASTEIAKITEKNRSEVANRKEIVIASLYQDYDLKGAVIEFNKQNPDYHVTIKDYYNYENQDATLDDARNTMTNDIGGANVPDLVNLEYLPVEQFSKKGVFEDLTTYLDSSSSLNLDDYNKSVLDCFRYDDKLISIPRSYELQTMVVSSKVFGDKAGWSIDEMIDYDLAHPESVIIDYSMRYYIMQICLYNNLDYFLNWDTGECKFESDEFKKILEYVASFPEDLDWEAIDADTTSDAEKLANGRVTAHIAYLYNLQSVQEYSDYLFAKNANFIGFPTVDGTPSSLIQPTGAYAICSGSPNKEAAWKFIEFMLTQDYGENEFGFPANEKQLKAKIEEELKHTGKTGAGVGWGEGDMYEYHYATQEEIDKFYEILSVAKLNPGDQNEVFSIIDEETQSYFSGQKTLDECAKIIQSRVSLYVQENK